MMPSVTCSGSVDGSMNAAEVLVGLRHKEHDTVEEDDDEVVDDRDEERPVAQASLPPSLDAFLETVFSMVTVTEEFPVERWLRDWKRSTVGLSHAGKVFARSVELAAKPGGLRLSEKFLPQHTLDQVKCVRGGTQRARGGRLEGTIRRTSFHGRACFLYQIRHTTDKSASGTGNVLVLASVESILCSVQYLRGGYYSLRRSVEVLREVWVQASKSRVVGAVEFLDYVRGRKD